MNTFRFSKIYIFMETNKCQVIQKIDFIIILDFFWFASFVLLLAGFFFCITKIKKRPENYNLKSLLDDKLFAKLFQKVT